MEAAIILVFVINHEKVINFNFNIHLYTNMTKIITNAQELPPGLNLTTVRSEF